MPRPYKGETQEDFIARAIAEFRHEGYPEEEAIGRAYGFWRSYHKKEKRDTGMHDYSNHREKRGR